MKNSIKYISVLIFVFATILFFITYFSPSQPGMYDEFAKCLTEKGAIMYGTSTCSHCNNQKNLFENSFSFINYVDCIDNPAACDAADVKAVPVWVIDGTNHVGEKSLIQLSELSGCKL